MAKVYENEFKLMIAGDRNPKLSRFFGTVGLLPVARF